MQKDAQLQLAKVKRKKSYKYIDQIKMKSLININSACFGQTKQVSLLLEMHTKIINLTTYQTKIILRKTFCTSLKNLIFKQLFLLKTRQIWIFYGSLK